jgi:hypothetical protein
MNRPLCVALVLSMLMLAGCAKPSTSWIRTWPTGIQSGEAIAVVLKSIARPGGSEPVTEADQLSMASCIGQGLRAVERSLDIVKSGEPQVRYVVTLDIRTLHSRTELETAGQGVLIFPLGTIGGKWTETSHISGQVFDVKNRRVAGTVSSSATGEEGAGVGIYLIIPFPYAYWSNTESRACKALGEELARFITVPDANRYHTGSSSRPSAPPFPAGIVEQTPKLQNYGCAPFNARAGNVYWHEDGRRIAIARVLGLSEQCTNPRPLSVELELE